ncbi:MAG TPA: ABC transporter ATP-binding protein [Acidimicrobiales bacterium]|nr:ABC transporter ATP-binding protein [Acidimicrobiales bacterium]
MPGREIANPMLECDSVSIRFGGVQALSDVFLQVGPKEIVGILGPNGAGKTTLFNCVSGFYTPTRGRVRLFDEEVTFFKPEARAQRGLGRTFQQVGLVRSFTVLENLVVAQHMSGRSTGLASIMGTARARAEERLFRQRADDVLEFMGLGAVRERRIGGLPYGTLKMVEVAAVLATDPSILMLDEPLAGASGEEGSVFCDRVEQMRDELGLSIILIEHHVPLVLRTSDYVYVLNFGALLAEGLPDEVRDNSAVAEAYMGEGASSLV